MIGNLSGVGDDLAELKNIGTSVKLSLEVAKTGKYPVILIRCDNDVKFLMLKAGVDFEHFGNIYIKDGMQTLSLTLVDNPFDSSLRDVKHTLLVPERIKFSPSLFDNTVAM
ncbi:hypothetical protein [Catenovulum sediminis]|uniref:Uncharacterized protein n=1 Tax=Catenovulum sediminis TaxID=1740262 RepID=A0ABV1RCB7_9ALTE